MAISDELTRIQTAKADIKASIEAKGVTVPSSALIDEYADYVDEISGGGGGQAEEVLKNLIERDITSITIPTGTTSISKSAFESCIYLTSITIPDSVTSIGMNAFSGCDNLTSITIPDSVTSIGNYAFQRCSSLTRLNSDVDGLFNIPDSVTSISNYVFDSCKSLTSVNIPDGVTSIGGSAFRFCSSLTSVTIETTTPPTLGSNAFYSTNDCPIYVPAESVEAYKAASGWSTYASRIFAIPSE